MKAFKVTKDQLVSAVVNIQKITVNPAAFCSASGLGYARIRTDRTKILQGIFFQHK
jgi:hypothetical protein